MGSSHDRVGRTSSGPNLPHFPFITSTQSSSGFMQPMSAVRAGAAASLAQHSLAGLQSVFLPQVLPEHSALASLAQYGSAEASPCYTPPVHSPSIQSPVKGRTVYHSELPSTTSSHSPLTLQTSCPARVACTFKESAESSVDLFTQEIKTISGSHSSIHQERPLAMSSSSEAGVAGVSSPFSSPMAVSKPYTPILGQATPVSRTHSGPEPQNQSVGVHSPHARSPAKMLETEHKQSKLPSNL
ncbi:potassium/sodium hyperpolarization-activated cyclic nucleotide-gated channel 3-like protein [Lates japonicus]|uniref:Potassium/sodium hyperpolarization-activated cyclic nucleotide-gated channel 3-like protein n=1 Tax=Lates japonicus TaxID=270547 RepID=A0AAD3MS71_LATJO|nr:potassium/sodium hyperpolarization-activated cyclic nucleotide-gated channel 3-like protein [Lates japonicus]